MSDYATRLLIRPRLTEFYGVARSQADVDFAIPFLEEDLPLYVDPFLLWKSPSLQDQALHTAMITAFNRIGMRSKSGEHEQAQRLLVRLSECDEVGLGNSAKRQGKRIGSAQADAIISLFQNIPHYATNGFTHFEEIQFFIDGISRDRVSDFACNLLKSWLIDYTMEQSQKIGLPCSKATIGEMYDHQRHDIIEGQAFDLPVHPSTGKPLLLVPKRWLRHAPWLNFDVYFKDYIPKDDAHNQVVWDRPALLQFNRDNYGVVADFVRLQERTAVSCNADPLFTQIPVISAKRKLTEILKLPTGKDENADRKYEDAATALLASMFYPQLDFADTQVRVDSGAQIRDLIFYMNREVGFLKDIADEYDVRQLVVELKNVKAIEREHINQLFRYLSGPFGRVGFFLTRHPLPRAMRTSTIDLWSSKRVCLLPLTDADLVTMVDLFESKQRAPLDVLQRSFIEFQRECPI